MPRIIPVDFETEAIQKRPMYPPKPVGVAIKINGKRKYFAWGHPQENNCTRMEAKKVLLYVFKNHVPLFHNAAFDIEVGMRYLQLPFPRIGYHDTLFLAFLSDPRADSLSLKSLAENLLGMPPDEQTKLHSWILENVFEPNSVRPTKKNPLAAHIAEAPGRLVGTYAVGDIVRTEKLFEHLMPQIKSRGMLAAYEREKLCLPIFEGMSTKGLKIKTRKLKKHLAEWKIGQEKREQWIRKRLKTPGLEINSSRQLANALAKTGSVADADWIMTAPTKTFPQGQRSTKRKTLLKICRDKKLTAALALHGVFSTYIAVFAEAWLATADVYSGRVYPSFSQVRSADEHKGAMRGSRTGRPSSNHPNFLNVPRNQENPLLPNLRDYIAPDDGHVFLIRDYSQQELRVLAHFEEATLLAAYIKNPEMDVHSYVGKLIYKTTGVKYPRSYIKTISFGILYGMGTALLGDSLDISNEEANQLKNHYYKTLPGVAQLNKNLIQRSKLGGAITTWGGREYFAEPPKIIGGQRRDFYYKQLNYLIQGSAADCTKEAMVAVDEKIKPLGGRIVLQIYDEIVTSVPVEVAKEAMAAQKIGMESVAFKVKMLTTGKIGKKSWGEAKICGW